MDSHKQFTIPQVLFIWSILSLYIQIINILYAWGNQTDLSTSALPVTICSFSQVLMDESHDILQMSNLRCWVMFPATVKKYRHVQESSTNVINNIIIMNIVQGRQKYHNIHFHFWRTFIVSWWRITEVLLYKYVANYST